MSALHDRVDEMRRAYHDRVDPGAGDIRVPGEARQRGEDPAGHVFSCRSLDTMYDARTVEQHRIGVGAADIDADAPHGQRPGMTGWGKPRCSHANTELNWMAYANERAHS